MGFQTLDNKQHKTMIPKRTEKNGDKPFDCSWFLLGSSFQIAELMRTQTVPSSQVEETKVSCWSKKGKAKTCKAER